MSEKSKKAEMLSLIEKLNEAAMAYYQGSEEIMSNFEYDELYDELIKLEMETGITMAGSPTQKVGYEVISGLPKEAHDHPMLSLDKTKDRDSLVDWLGDHKGLLSWKLDGLTVVLHYREGKLAKALTRGNGIIGEVITGNAKTFINLPLSIPYKKDLTLRGEAIITYEDFQKINESLPENEEHYKNPRNLCSGSVRQLNSEITAKRRVRFIAFGLVSMDNIEAEERFKYRSQEMEWLDNQGFETVERKSVIGDDVVKTVESFENTIDGNPYPSDGLVLVLDDIDYGKSLGRTAKFPRDAIAFKWKDQVAETTLREILWSASRTGLINPIAIFDKVELEGTEVSRASLHNVSIMKSLKMGIGDRIRVYKANMIIPQVSENLTMSDTVRIPVECPVCGTETKLRDDDGIITLHCPNPSCPAKSIKRLTLLTGRNALDIEGISEATLERFTGEGFIREAADIFKIGRYKNEITSMEGFGEKSFENMMKSIEKARNTTAHRLLYAIGIPGIGTANAKLIAAACDENWEKIISLTESDLMEIEGVGPVLARGFVDFFKDHVKASEVSNLRNELYLEEGSSLKDDYFAGLTFVITGSLKAYENRDQLKGVIEQAGGKVAGSVSSRTAYLINNDISSTSGKNKKAKELGVPIIDEATVTRWIQDKKVSQVSI
ncbi:NAD-dependent DNA ligase LigA [Anaerovoracaceae bacterium SGI.195]